MPAIGSILTAVPSSYKNEFNYTITGIVTDFSNNTIRLVGGSTTTNAYVGQALCFVNQANPPINRTITAYDRSTKMASLSGTDWGTYTPIAGTTIWAICNEYPVDRRFQWIKDGLDIPGAIGGSFTPYEPGAYQVRETAFFPSTNTLITTSISSPIIITGTRNTELVYQDNIVWQGCFYAPVLPSSDVLGINGVCAYNPSGNGGLGSLFLTGTDHKVGEVAIPTAFGTTADAVPEATILSGASLVDILEGQRTISGISSSGQIRITGLLVNNGKLLVTAHGDNTYNLASWFWRRPLNISTTGQIEGPIAVTDLQFLDNPTNCAGYMANIPQSLQGILGNSVVSGFATESTVSNTSDGPSYSSFNPEDFVSASANVRRGTFVAATTNTMNLSSGINMSTLIDFYVGYWLVSEDGSSFARKVSSYDPTTKIATVDISWNTIPTTGNWVLIPPVLAKTLCMYNEGDLEVSTPRGHSYIWDGSCSPIGGCAIPNGTRSILTFSQGGNNTFLYSPVNQVSYGIKAYDPTAQASNERNYPYFNRCWAYDVLDLEQARLNNIDPKDVKPYAVWNFNMPILNGNGGVKGVAYDSANKRLFLTNNSGPNGRTVVHVYTVTNAIPI
jgi:hypothetical protein